MTTPTFRQWLKRYRDEDHAIGDLARDVARETHLPALKDRAAWERYLGSQHACDAAMTTLHEAWDAYEHELGRPSSRTPTCAQCGCVLVCEYYDDDELCEDCREDDD